MAFDLGAMLRDVSELDTGREQIEYIHLDLIDSDPNNFYQLTDIDKLADNISLCGLQQPIRVRQQENGRYMIVSGHRRRAALEMLVADGHKDFEEAACIVERDIASPALQQLRLIYANANTRRMTSSEISEQAVQVEKLLYQLKEEGYEFPGRMRDHVAQAVGASKTKLARLKVIRDNLAKCWRSLYVKDTLKESAAYSLAQLTTEDQQLIFDAKSKTNEQKYISSGAVDHYADRFAMIDKLKCSRSKGAPCENYDRKRRQALQENLYGSYNCGRCCKECSKLLSCKNACPKLADVIKQKRAANREARKHDREIQEEKDRPIIERLTDLWNRFRCAREYSGVSVKEVYEAAGIYYSSSTEKQVLEIESGVAPIKANTEPPYGTNFYLWEMDRLVRVANLFNCSIDYLLGRTEEIRPLTGWQTGYPWNFGEYVVLVRYDSAKAPTPEKMTWTEDGWEMLGTAFEEICPDAVIIGWIPMPEDET